MKIFIVLFITSFSLTTSKNWVRRVTQSDETGSDYSDIFQVQNEDTNDKGFCYQGILRQTFAFEALYDKSHTNAACSPIAAQLLLGKLMIGASDKGLQELTGMMGVEYQTDESSEHTLQIPKVFKQLLKDLHKLTGMRLDLVSKIYVPQNVVIKKKFVKAFSSSIGKVSFKKPIHAVDQINGWVSRKTGGAIPLIMEQQQILPNSSAVIVNAVYFQGVWRNPFHKIEVADFFAPSGQKKIQLMTRQDFFRYEESAALDAQIIEIPFKGLRCSFIVVLPNEINGLPFLLKALKLTPSLLYRASKSMKKQLAIVSIPKFRIQGTINLKDVFSKMGMEQILSSASGLTEILQDEELQITTAVQKCVIEIEGDISTTTTPDASESGPMTETPDLDQVIFVANHPFLFYVKVHKEQLLAGIFNEP